MIDRLFYVFVYSLDPLCPLKFKWYRFGARELVEPWASEKAVRMLNIDP